MQISRRTFLTSVAASLGLAAPLHLFARAEQERRDMLQVKALLVATGKPNRNDDVFDLNAFRQSVSYSSARQDAELFRKRYFGEFAEPQGLIKREDLARATISPDQIVNTKPNGPAILVRGEDGMYAWMCVGVDWGSPNPSMSCAFIRFE